MNVNQCMESLVVFSKPLAVREYRLYFKRLNLGVYLNRLHVSLKKMNLRLTRSCLDGVTGAPEGPYWVFGCCGSLLRSHSIDPPEHFPEPQVSGCWPWLANS